jgi:hypothetical protein
MKKRLGWTLLALAVMVLPLLVGCAAMAPTREAAPAQPPELVKQDNALSPAGERSMATSGGQEGMPGLTDVERKIIYSVTLDLIVKDTEAAFGEVQRLTQEMGGFVSESNMWRDEGHPRASMSVRVPADRLDEALAGFRNLALDVERENRDSQDVTEEYVDLGARLKNAQRTETELLELLRSRSETGKTEDILEVYRELSQVRSQIEQIQGRIKYLENLSSMATVQITLTPDVLLQPVVVAGWRPQGTARSAVRMLLRALQFMADAAIFVLLLVLPILLVVAVFLAILYWIARAILRWVRRRQVEAPSGT